MRPNTQKESPIESGIEPRACGKAQASARAFPRLDIRTHKNQRKESDREDSGKQPPKGTHWRIEISDFEDGVVEGLAVRMDTQGKKPKKGKRKTGDRSQMTDENRQRAAARARKKVRHKILKMKADRMLTLTSQRNIEDRDEFMEIFGRFKRACNKQFGGFTYVMVLERHKKNRNGFHAHLALNQYYNVNVLRRIWIKALGSLGNVDVKKQGVGVMQRCRIAKYMAKYMGKDMDKGEINTKRYMCSRDIGEPKKTVIYMPIMMDPFYVVKAMIEKAVGKPMLSYWETHSGEFNTYPMIWYASYDVRRRAEKSYPE